MKFNLSNLICGKRSKCSKQDTSLPNPEDSRVFSLSMLSNAAAHFCGNGNGTDQELEDYTRNVIKTMFYDEEVTRLIGSWSLAWGPRVIQVKNSKVGDNTMYVAQNNTNPNEFVIAIAGTFFKSLFDLFEDFWLIPLQSWGGVREKGDIAYGSSVGLEVLLNMKDSGTNMSIKDFLKREAQNYREPLKITVCGHSLGGALSPLLALELLESQDDWDKGKLAQIHVKPTAGPTAGNEAWRDYYDAKLGTSTTRVWNKIDIVPNAWDPITLEKMKAVYPTLDVIKTAICFTQGLNMKQIRPDSEPFCSELNPCIKCVKEQIEYQHVDKYIEYFKIKKFYEIYQNVLNRLNPSSCKNLDADHDDM